MGQTIGYIRVSSDKQTVDNQRLAILDYCNKQDIKVDDWIEVNMSSKRTPAQRRIDELLHRLQEGKLLIVAELSRLARSVGQIAVLIDVTGLCADTESYFAALMDRMSGPAFLSPIEVIPVHADRIIASGIMTVVSTIAFAHDQFLLSVVVEIS